MPQVVKKRRSGWAVLAVGALVASLFAVGVAPAGAAEIQAGAANTAEPSKAASQTACVGDATTDQMFNDVPAGHDFEGAINCIAYYDITKGTGDGSTFSPGDNVSRWQMALFLSRAADAAGAPLGMAADQGFADIGDAPDEAQGAINDLAAAGIMSGASGTDFDPHGDVTRADMAGFLVRLLARTAPGVVQVSAGGSVTYGSNKQALSSADLDHFADARSLPRSADDLISAAYELGITNGTGDGSTFSPSGTVDRGQMAAFITRTLNHTNLRPEGISAQKVGSTVRVAVRDADLKPEINAWVDSFSVAAARADDVFSTNDDGDRTSCTRLPSAVEGSRSCEIDRADGLTDGDGNVEFDISHGDTNVAVWVWTGEIGDRVGASTQLAMVTVTPATLGVVTAAVSDNLPDPPKDAKARFGDSVTITVQLQDANGDAVGPDGTSYVYAYSTSTYEDGRRVEQSRSSTLAIGADGSASFTISLADPGQRATDNNIGRIEYSIVQVKAPRGITLKDASGSVTFDDDPGGTLAEVTVTTDGYDDYRSGGSSTVVSVNVVDMYGDPVSRQSVTLGCGASSRAYTTNSDGNVRIPQTWRGGAGTQSICATAGGKNSGPSEFHWLDSRTVGSSGNGTVLAGDADRDEVVVHHGGVPVLLYYDDNDRYSTQSGGAVGLSAFEKALGADFKDSVNDLTLTWRYYDVRDPSDITEWSLDDVPTVSSDAPYITTASAVAGEVTLTFSEALDLRSGYTARSWQFTVAGSVGGAQDVDGVTMLGTTEGGSSAQVMLDTSPRSDDPDTEDVDESTEQLTAADTVTVSYSSNASAPDGTAEDYDDARQLRADEYPDLSVLGFSRSVRNDIPPVLVPNVATAALPDGNPVVVLNQLTMVFNAALSSSAVPAASQFTVEVNGAPRDVSSVSISGAAVTLTLASNVATSNDVDVSYTEPETGIGLHAAVSSQARVESIDSVPVIVVDTANVTPPILVTGDTNVNAETVTLAFDRNLAVGVQYTPDASQFQLNGVEQTVSMVTLDTAGDDDSHVVSLTLSAAVTAADGVSITYSHIAVDANGRLLPEESHLLRDAGTDVRRQPVRGFTEAIRNATPPVLASANVNGDKLTLTFNARLDSTSTPPGSTLNITGGVLKADDADTENVDESSGNVRVSGSTVVLTLNEAVGADTTVAVAYSSDDSLRSAQSKDGDASVTTFTTGQDDAPAVINTTAPALSDTDATASGNTVTVDSNVSMANLMITGFEVVFSEQRGHTGQFAVTVTAVDTTVAVPRSVTRVAVSGETITLTIDGDALVGQDSVMVTYTMSDNAGYRLKSATGAELADGVVTVTVN